MHPPARQPLVDALDPAVVSFTAPDDDFTLRDDLDRLDRVRAAGAAEAVVLYCTRILEAMARELLLRDLGRASDRVAENLNLLREYRALPAPLKRWLDRLRDLGNHARHARQRVTGADADMAFALLLRWLNWYFCEYPWGQRRAGIALYNRPWEGLLPAGFADLLDRVDRPEGPDPELLSSLRRGDGANPLLLTPVVPAVLAEVLLGRDRLPEAYAVLDAARRKFDRDLRLLQLEGLYWSRRGRAEGNPHYLRQARDRLIGLPPTGSPADEETFGILAGVYKGLAELEGDDPWLRESHETYAEGWQRSQQTNNYLGINAAATALWLGDGEKAKLLAGQVREALEKLRAQLEARPGGAGRLTYWDQVTLAEACLLAGDLEGAGRLYGDAFTRFRDDTRNIQVTKEQARRDLEELGLADRAAEVLGE